MFTYQSKPQAFLKPLKSKQNTVIKYILGDLVQQIIPRQMPQLQTSYD